MLLITIVIWLTCEQHLFCQTFLVTVIRCYLSVILVIVNLIYGVSQIHPSNRNKIVLFYGHFWYCMGDMRHFQLILLLGCYISSYKRHQLWKLSMFWCLLSVLSPLRNWLVRTQLSLYLAYLFTLHVHSSQLVSFIVRVEA